ncbi:maleate cis-trans isomerase family protein [Humitalea sp. 24SJ18S-53]|uniref:maleate cis-trans isomerase family protein n=1 Tax=Humitalea sp. 24SJ18S-53 TaxID=3422307 RepID=UPI003D67A494
MSLEYAPRGLLGVLTPQANTTVEPEMALLLPPGMAMLNARMCSDKDSMIARLLDYMDGLEASVAQFANAPVGAFAFACTGASYFAGPANEDAKVAAIEAARQKPFITAGRAVCDAFRVLGAQRIGLVSPYPPDLTEAAVGYFSARGLTIERVAGAALQTAAFHPIYAMAADTAEAALHGIDTTGLDAIVMLGTGMPTLRPILGWKGGTPVVSCMLSLAWRSVCAIEGRAPDRTSLEAYMRGDGWGARLG